MALKIVSADTRIAELESKTTVAIFGPVGGGKTTLLKTLLEKTTLCVDLEAGMKSVQDWRGLNANVEHPWQRTGFRHPDLMTWVRANRARLVAACLTLCQAWIAAGRPQGSRSIGSFESWAHILGGVLDIAGIDGFLGNIDEMMEASDTEGSAWSGFVNAWWTAFGTAEVGTAHLHPVAMSCEPAIKLNGTTEKAQKTSLGMALGKMRDRVFAIDQMQVRLEKVGVSHQARKWHLVVVREGQPSARPVQGLNRGEPFPEAGNLCKKGSPAQPPESKGCGEPGEPFSDPYAHTRTRARERESGKGSLGSPGSPGAVESMGYAGEPSGEPLGESSKGPPIPDWLREVDE